MSTFSTECPVYPPLTAVRAEPSAGPARFDLYAGIHKAIRCFMGDTLVRLGRMDPADPLAVRHTLDQVEQLLAFCGQHVEHENDFVHPAVEAAHLGASQAIAHEHAEHVAAIAALAGQAATLRAMPTPAAAHRLYRALACFIADNLLHMDTEETLHNRVLWATYSDEQLAAIHGRLVAAIPPAEMAVGLHWMQAALAPAELAAMGPPA